MVAIQKSLPHLSKIYLYLEKLSTRKQEQGQRRTAVDRMSYLKRQKKSISFHSSFLNKNFMDFGLENMQKLFVFARHKGVFSILLIQAEILALK